MKDLEAFPPSEPPKRLHRDCQGHGPALKSRWVYKGALRGIIPSFDQIYRQGYLIYASFGSLDQKGGHSLHILRVYLKISLPILGNLRRTHCCLHVHSEGSWATDLVFMIHFSSFGSLTFVEVNEERRIAKGDRSLQTPCLTLLKPCSGLDFAS